MKKIISVLLALTIVLSALFASFTLAKAATYIDYGDWMLEVNDDNTYYIGGYTGTDTELEFPEKANGKTIKGVGSHFIDNCETDITSVLIPDSFTIIGAYAFSGCAALESVNIPSSLTKIGNMAFSGCSSLNNIDFSSADSASQIPYGCFSGCSSLSSIVLPEKLTSIGDYAFSNSALQSIDIPDSVTSIGSYSFNRCSSLTDVTLSNGLVSIGEGAFYYAESLKAVYVPVSVSSIGLYAFYPMAIEDDGSMIIDCYTDTYAAQYAYENFLNCTKCSLVKGDANNDGVTNIRDVTYIQLYRADLYEIGTDPKTIDRVDVTGDYQVTLRDATQIQLFRAGIIDSL